MQNIFVSGVSGIVGYGIARSIMQSDRDYSVVGSSIYEDSVAQGFCDYFEHAPPTNDDCYIDWLCSIIDRYSINLLIPGLEVDMYKWLANIEVLERSGAKLALNNHELIHLCNDKWKFYERLHDASLGCDIPTVLEKNFDYCASQFGLPFLLKPRHGYGSKGIVEVNSEEEFLAFQDEIGHNLMVQPIIGDDSEEYTISVFGDGVGAMSAIMTLKRKLSKDGFTDRAEVVSSNEFEQIVHALCEEFKPIGPTNLQFRRHGDNFKLLEINPRLSSSTSIRTAFGYNESVMAIEYFLSGTLPMQPAIRSGRAVRYVEDFIFYEDRIDI